MTKQKQPQISLIPRYYQNNAVREFFSYIDYNPGRHPLIVLPTGSGKSAVMAMIILEMLKFEGTRVLVLAHRAKLIEQNAQELTGLLNNIFYDVGIYSASLKQRDTQSRVLFAGIQSVYNKAWELGFFDMILVDEAHRINIKAEGMYRQFLDEQTKINPKIVIGGLTATHYRTKGGLICDEAHENRIFNDVCYEVSIRELMDSGHLKNRDKQQYLCPIISPSKSMQSRVDLSGVSIRGGEYVQNEMENAFMVDDLIENTVNEILSYVQDRNKVLIFTAGKRHCGTVYQTLLAKSCTVGMVHSGFKHEENEQILKDFSDGRIKFLLNIDVLTEGYNDKSIDCIAVLRATQSVGLWVQIVGRGFRLHPSKDDCLILDFGGNIMRHGPVDKIEVKRQKNGEGRTVYTSPQKECPNCKSLIAIQALTCPDCGYEFPLPERHDDEASTENILSKWKPPVEYEVHHVTYSRHEKKDKPDSMRVDYHIDMGTRFSEYICLDHDGFAKKKALQWVAKRTSERIDTVDVALICKELFRQPKSILVNENDKFPRIVSYIFETAEEEAARKEAERIADEMRENEKIGALIW
jgi:DNA repair protein RadD